MLESLAPPSSPPPSDDPRRKPRVNLEPLNDESPSMLSGGKFDGYHSYNPQGREDRRGQVTFAIKVLIVLGFFSIYQMGLLGSSYMEHHTEALSQRDNSYGDNILQRQEERKRQQSLQHSPTNEAFKFAFDPQDKVDSIRDSVESKASPTTFDDRNNVTLLRRTAKNSDAIVSTSSTTAGKIKNSGKQTTPNKRGDKTELLGTTKDGRDKNNNVTYTRSSGDNAKNRDDKVNLKMTSNDEERKSPEELQSELYAMTKSKFYETEAWKNVSTFTKVNRTTYRELARIAQIAAAPVANDVFTDCEIHFIPSEKTTTATTMEDITFDQGKPDMRFLCLGTQNSTGDNILSSRSFQKELCHTVSICKVVLDKDLWKTQLSSHSDLQIVDHSKTKRETVILLMVDSLKYITEDRAYQATINKASYAYRSNRPFYIWIGNLNQTDLNERNLDNVYNAFGAPCAPKHLKNSLHYYKAIALLVLLDIISENGEGSSILLMDADADFTSSAFERLNDDSKVVGPESYLELSPQASLIGTQNTKGKMLMNGGLLLVRNTKWARDFAALWWYTRCGEKDQLALWTILFATFSAWTTLPDQCVPTRIGDDLTIMNTTVPDQFSYPGQSFFAYETANVKTYGHFRKFGHNIQASWEDVVERCRHENSTIEDTYDFPIPTNIQDFNGGSHAGLRPILKGAMELPHVMILPQRSIQTREADGETKELLRFKGEDGEVFTAHSKRLTSCSNARCWPYYHDAN